MDTSLPSYFSTDNLFRILVIVGVGLFLRILVALFLKGFVHNLAANASRSRVSTLSSVLSTIISTIIWLVTLIMLLKVIGLDVTPILASAGVVGIAIAFGAQTLVKDLLSGFFLLIEDQLREGEQVELAGKKGIVEKATLRAVTLREKSGELSTIPYSGITVVTNFSRKR